MKPVRKSLAVIVLGGSSVAAFAFGTTVLQNARFARAEQQVETSRDQLARAEDLSSVFRNVGKVVEPSVVNLTVRKAGGVTGNRQLPFDDDMLRRFFPDRDGDGRPDLPEGFGGRGNNPGGPGGGDDEGDAPGGPGGGFEQMGTGSGVIMETSGSTAYILTNNHVAGGASEIVVTLADGRRIENGKVLGTDPKTDLAVVQIQADRLIPAKWGDSEQLEKGDWIMAFGSPFGYVGSMTHGIVSALNRQAGILGQQGYESFIQVDAPINPGNSGGPLVNTRGEVVGINTAIASRSGGFQGIGFAIPSNQAKFVYAALKDKGRVTRGWLGVSIMDVSREADKIQQTLGFKGTDGVLVQETFAKTPATGKLQAGDIVTEMNGKPVKTVQQLRNTIAAMTPGSELKLKVFREGADADVSITLGEQPEDLTAVAGRRGLPGGGPAAADDNKADALGMKLATPSEELAQKFGLGDEPPKGAIITDVQPRSAAAKAGLRPGDLITKVAGKTVTTAKEAGDAIAKADPGKTLLLYVSSGQGGSRFVFVEPAAKK